MSDSESKIESIGGGVKVHVSGDHTFGTDAFLLSHFAAPRPSSTVCDLGSGCGIVPLLWFRDKGAPAVVHTLDLQRPAVELLEASVRDSGLEGSVFPHQGDLRELGAELPLGTFHLATCNPPYYNSGSGEQNSSQAARIARHEITCTLEDVCAAAAKLLRYGGRFCLCQLPERLTDVLCALRAHNLEPKRLRLVQQTAVSAPWLLLAEGRLGGKPSLAVEPPLILREGDGPSPEMAHIYRYYGKV